MSTALTGRAPATALHIALWIGQLLLAALFAFAGAMKVGKAVQFPFPVALTYFIGVSELAGAVGLVVPALTRIKPGLTPIAAAALALVMVLATGYHFFMDEPVAQTASFAAVALFVAWGRRYKAPIQPR